MSTEQAPNADGPELDTARYAPRPLAGIEADAIASRPGMQIVETPTARVRIRRAIVPDTPTLILLPDGPNVIEHYDPLFAHYAGLMSVVAIEIPGFGFSYATHVEALSFTGCVDVCERVLRELDLDDMIVTGPCVQAYVAIALGARMRAKVRGVVALQATDIAGERRWMERAIDPHNVLRQPGVGQRFWADPGVRRAQAIERWYPIAAAPEFDVAPWQEIARWSINTGCSNALATLCQTWFAKDRGSLDLPVYDGPARILFGAADRTHAACGSDPGGLRLYLPHAMTAILPAAGHFTDLEAMSEFTNTVDELIAGTGH